MFIDILFCIVFFSCMDTFVPVFVWREDFSTLFYFLTFLVLVRKKNTELNLS